MVERNFDLCELVKGAGATFVARGTVYHAKQLTDLIVAGAQNQGFSVIEAVSQCPVSYGEGINEKCFRDDQLAEGTCG